MPDKPAMYTAAPHPDRDDLVLVHRNDNGNPFVRVATIRRQENGHWVTSIDEPSGFGGRLPDDFAPTTTWEEAAQNIASWSDNRITILH